MEEVISYKIILVGDSNVGKSCLFSKYTKNQYPKNPEPTVGQEFKTKPFTMPDGKSVKAQIWDTAGQERYRSMMSTNYRKAVGALLVYDITLRDSFDSLRKWVEDIKTQSEPGCIILLVGNKSDQSSSRVVQQSEAKQFAEENEFEFLETSALNGININEAFEKLLHKIHEQRATLSRQIAQAQAQKQAPQTQAVQSGAEGGAPQPGVNQAATSISVQKEKKNDDGCKC